MDPALKWSLIAAAFTIGLVLGFWPGGVSAPKPAWWRWTAVGSMLLLFGLGLAIPLGGTFVDASLVTLKRPGAHLPVRATVLEANDKSLRLRDVRGMELTAPVAWSDPEEARGIEVGQTLLVDMTYDRTTKTFTAHRVIATNPWATHALIPALEEMARNLYFHVPTAWLSQMAWFIAFAFAVGYLRKRDPASDVKASAAAAIGALFCILAAVTGSVWARFTWGDFWNWDPRQVSIFVVLIIFGAYFALRSAIDNDEQRARISSIYLILLAVPVLFFMFVLPRLVEGLHPGSPPPGGELAGADTYTAGPILSAQEDSINPVQGYLFALSSFSYMMLFFWMLNLAVRTGLRELRRRQQTARRLDEESRMERAMDTDMVRLQ